MDSKYYIDTGWGCGAIITNQLGCVIKTAPIFKKFKGQNIERLEKSYNIHKIGVETTPKEDFF